MIGGKTHNFIIKKSYWKLFNCAASITFKILRQMSYFHIAQKNSIAKQVAQILSDGNKRSTFTKSKFNPVYQFEMNNQNHSFSSVRGHIFDYQLPPECKSWNNFDNSKILTNDVHIVKKLGPDMENLVQNIQYLAKKSKNLILWLDCDREGEAIAFEVIQIATKINPKLIIQRARFSAVTRTDILAAYNNLVQPNNLESDAVKYRIQIDFRLGCAFTRYQSLNFQRKYSLKQHHPISYGPCQLPTLGFVVERYLEIKYFQSEPYYLLNAQCIISNDEVISFKWTKKNVRLKISIDIIYANMFQRMNGQLKGKIIKRNQNVKKRYRPYPLTTVELQKIGTDKLRLSSAKIMEIAQKLYVSGYISYPRTQTNSFPKTFNLKNLIERIQSIPDYANYINGLKNNDKYMHPKMGNSDDQAHAPIHPVKKLQKQNVTNDQWRVYDLISRHFLACCSKDAVGKQYETIADIGGQQFKASYLVISQKNFLDIYPFIKWQSTVLNGEIPNEFPAIVNIQQNKTKPPAYLSESNLIQTMQKNNIGTDSTIHEHIETIQKRKYAVKIDNTLKPTNLGASLIIAYKNLNIKLVGCQVRREIQQTMNRISRGQILRSVAVDQMLANTIPIYQQLSLKKQQWINQLSMAMEQHKNLSNVEMDQKQFNQGGNNNNNNNNLQQNKMPFKCPKCLKMAKIIFSQKTSKFFIGCSNFPRCNWTCSLPRYIERISVTQNICSKCESNLCLIKRKQAIDIDSLQMKIRFSQVQSAFQNQLLVCVYPQCDRNFSDYPQFKISENNVLNNDNSRSISQSQARVPYHQNQGNMNNMNNVNNVNNMNNVINMNNMNNSSNDANRGKCYLCSSTDHYSKDCPTKYKSNNNSNNPPNKYSKPSSVDSYNSNTTSVKCFKCGQAGHYANKCPKLGNSNVNNSNPNNNFSNKNGGNYPLKNSYDNKNQNKQVKQKKICKECGVEGRHPNNSTCITLKKNKSAQNTDDEY